MGWRGVALIRDKQWLWPRTGETKKEGGMGNSRAGYSLPSFNNLFVVVILVLYPLPTHVDSKCIIFNFGDSNSDTGALTSGLGLYLGPPAGRQFFHKTTGRFCDGRLYIDFICMWLEFAYANIKLCLPWAVMYLLLNVSNNMFITVAGENLKINYLSPYLESSGSNFTHGVNFAVAGVATQMTGVPFPLSTQVLQFLHFKNRTRDLRSKGLFPSCESHYICFGPVGAHNINLGHLLRHISACLHLESAVCYKNILKL